MTKIGYAISSEEVTPNQAVRHAQKAEEIGFRFLLISDHFHPWTPAQGNSPFVWSVLGGIATMTSLIPVGTGVTCPTIRIHPAIIAQAAATVAAMMPGRFFLGVGTGENLNEHVLGDRWPAYEVRAEMLEEAVAVIRLLWEGGEKSHYGKYYTVENAQLFTLPDEPIPLMLAASGKNSAKLAARIGDGLINVSPQENINETYEKHGGDGPKYGKLTVSYAKDEKTARKQAYKYWSTSALKGGLSQELPRPAQFEQAAEMVTEDDVAQGIVCSPDPDKHLEAIYKYIESGFDHVYIHQVGPEQDEFFNFYQKSVLPEFSKVEIG